jgi:sugar lactone lactonase YvrE
MHLRIALAALVVLVGCAPPAEDVASTSATCPSFPHWAYDASHNWPQDRSLLRAEDGKALPDGRIVVADEAIGLRVIEADGTHRPFGQFVQNGYSHNPPEFPGGANGVLIENGGTNVLVSDVYSGMIYRVDIATEATTIIYDHPYGVNAIDQDSRGTIWFTQSAENTPEQGGIGLFGALDLSVPTGAVYKLAREGDGYASQAEEVLGGIYFANGIAIDNTESYLYLAELMMDRILRYRFDVASGTVSGREVHHMVLTPDNLAIDPDNNLWIASPLGNAVSWWMGGLPGAIWASRGSSS